MKIQWLTHLRLTQQTEHQEHTGDYLKRKGQYTGDINIKSE